MRKGIFSETKESGNLAKSELMGERVCQDVQRTSYIYLSFYLHRPIGDIQSPLLEDILLEVQQGFFCLDSHKVLSNWKRRDRGKRVMPC